MYSNYDGGAPDLNKMYGPLPLKLWLAVGGGVVLLLIIVLAVVLSRKKPAPAPAPAPAKSATVAPSPSPAPAPAPAPAVVKPIAPPIPQEQAPQVTYTFYQGLDSGGNDIQQRADLANNVPGLKSACTALPNCKAFNTNGWIKHTVLPQAQWYKWTSDADKGMYTRN